MLLRFSEVGLELSQRKEFLFWSRQPLITPLFAGDRDSSYDDYLNDLQKGGDGECRFVSPSCHKATNPHLTRYGLYDYEYEHQCQGTTESSKKQKLFLMAWCPDSAKIKKKMLYSSSFDALKKSLVGVHKFIQVTSLLIFLKIFCYLK